jgi:hypothetical protein
MRKQLISLVAAASLALASVSSISAQVIAPVLGPPAPAIQPVTAAFAPWPPATIPGRQAWGEEDVLAIVHARVAARATGREVPTDLAAWPPPDQADGEGRGLPPAMVAWRPDAWLVDAGQAGRWWVMAEYRTVETADERAHQWDCPGCGLEE